MLVDLFKSLSDENRLRILHLLMQRSLCVCEIEQVLELQQSNVSRHLQKLKSSGLIQAKKQAQWVFYEVHHKASLEVKMLMDYLKLMFANHQVYQDDLEKLQGLDFTSLACKTMDE